MKLTQQQVGQLRFLRDLQKKSPSSQQPHITFCHECNMSNKALAALAAIEFIKNHSGHKTYHKLVDV